MTVRYYVQDQQVWMINAPGSFGNDSEVLTEPVARLTVARLKRDHAFYADVVAALRLAGLCEPDDREAS